VYTGGISVRLGESPVGTGVDRALAPSADHQAVEVRLLGHRGPNLPIGILSGKESTPHPAEIAWRSRLKATLA